VAIIGAVEIENETARVGEREEKKAVSSLTIAIKMATKESYDRPLLFRCCVFCYTV
jgi:hypothetical protein